MPALRELRRYVAPAVVPLALGLWASEASAGEPPPPPGISDVSTQISEAQATLFFDLNGDGFIDQLGGERLVIPPAPAVSAVLGNTSGEAGDATVVTLSEDGKLLTIQGRGRCRTEVGAIGAGVGGQGETLASHRTGFVVGSPGSFRFAGAVSASQPGDDVGDTTALMNLFGTQTVVEASADRVSGSASVDEAGPLEPGFYVVTAQCGSEAYRRPDVESPLGESSWEFTLTVTTGACAGDVLRWVGGRSGGFDEPGNWNPPSVPAFAEDGKCDTALVQGGRNVTIDLAAVAARLLDPFDAFDPRGVVRKIGRLVVRDSNGLRTAGGRLELDALSPILGERSLEVGANAQLLLDGGHLVARHVALGVDGTGELEVVGPAGIFENVGRLGVGATGEGSLRLRQGARVTSAEAVLGELDEPGAAVVQDAGTVWSTANLAVGLAHDATLEVLDGARVESDQSFVDFLLEGDESAFASLRGKDAQGNRATWSAQSLQVGKRGSVSVDDGGFLDVADNLLLSSGDAGEQGLNVVTVASGGQLAASSVNVGGTLVLFDGALALVTQYVRVGDATRPGSSGLLSVEGPAAGPRLDGPTDLTIEARGRAVVRIGAQANLLGTFTVGLDPASGAELRVAGGLEGVGEPSVLRAAVTDPIFSVVGATSDQPAGVFVAPTGRLVLEGGRIELLGPGHSLRIGRRGLLTGRGGTISIEPPGKLVNRGIIEGGFTLDGSYEQVRGAMVFGQILSPAGTPLNRVAFDPLAAAEFPRRAVRAKPAPSAFEPLVVTGDAVLDGRLTLQFGNGVAPRAGEAFELLDVGGTVTGDFAEVVIQGLVPESLAFEPSLVGGKLALTFTKDAVALPAVSLKAKATLKETAKKGGKIKLKRTGDTSAPLVLTYRVGGTAQSGVDFEALPGTIEIPAKKKSATIVVRPIADGLLEGPETIELELAPGDTYAPGVVSTVTVELLSKDR